MKTKMILVLCLLTSVNVLADEVYTCRSYKVPPKPAPVAPAPTPDIFDKARTLYDKLYNKMFPPPTISTEDQSTIFKLGNISSMLDTRNYTIKYENGQYFGYFGGIISIPSYQNEKEALSVVSNTDLVLVLSRMFTFQTPGKKLDTFITTYNIEKSNHVFTLTTTVNGELLNTYVGTCLIQ